MREGRSEKRKRVREWKREQRQEQRTLLLEALGKHAPDLLGLIERVDSFSLDEEQRNRLIDAVASEMLSTGMGDLALNDRDEKLRDVVSLLLNATQEGA